MVEQGSGGSIVHISSIYSKVVPVPKVTSLAAAKGAVDSLAQAMALELGPHKVNLSLSYTGAGTTYGKSFSLLKLELGPHKVNLSLSYTGAGTT